MCRHLESKISFELFLERHIKLHFYFQNMNCLNSEAQLRRFADSVITNIVEGYRWIIL